MPAEPVQRIIRATRLVSPLRRAVEPLIHAPEAVEAARVGRIRVVDDTVLERERAHAWTLPDIGRPIGPGRCGPFGEGPLFAEPDGRRRIHLLEVVIASPGALLLLRLADVE